MPQASVPTSAISVEKADAMSELSFPANALQALQLKEACVWMLQCCANQFQALRRYVEGLFELTRFSAGELVPAATRADGAPLPNIFVRLAFGAAPDTEAEAS